MLPLTLAPQQSTSCPVRRSNANVRVVCWIDRWLVTSDTLLVWFHTATDELPLLGSPLIV